jgi:hypothetical protein
MMDKRLIFPGNTNDNRDLFFVKEDRNYLVKKASNYHPKIAQYIEKAQPIDDLVQVLLTALGAYEAWGQNVNGDIFKIPALSHEGDDYGYQTFKTTGNYFTHHNNKDPALAKGKVLHSVWNDKAKRVELVVGINPKLDPDAIAEISNGNDLCFSMGAKVPYDVCSVCGNKAKTRADYCEHLRYMLNQIDPVSGLLVGADNTFPKFFDISRVLIPADKTAYMWTKVASAANPFQKLSSSFLAALPAGKLNDTEFLQKCADEQAEIARDRFSTKKIAVVNKDASIIKRVPLKIDANASDKINADSTGLEQLESSVGTAAKALQAVSPDIPKEKFLKAKDKSDAILTMLLLGMVPKVGELDSLKEADEPAASFPSGVAHKTAEAFNSELAEDLSGFIPERSFARPFLLQRSIKLASQLELEKTAETVNDLMERNRNPQLKPSPISPELLVGSLAAIFAASPLIRKMVMNNPLIAMALGAGLLAGGKTLIDTPPRTGFYDVDAGISGLYNKGWQSRFMDYQSRPVTVIKTANDRNVGLYKKLFYGVPAIYLTSKLYDTYHDLHPEKRRHPVIGTIAKHPDLLSFGLIGEHLGGRPVSKRISALLESGKRAVKTASLNDIEFLSSAPEEERELLWDFAILDCANRISDKLLGG